MAQHARRIAAPLNDSFATDDDGLPSSAEISFSTSSGSGRAMAAAAPSREVYSSAGTGAPWIAMGKRAQQQTPEAKQYYV